MALIKHITFEANNLSEFDSTVTDGGDLTASAAAAMVGSYGMAAVIDDTTAISGTITATNKTELRIRFYFDPNSITMSNGDDFYLLNDSGNADFRFRFKRASSTYYLYGTVYNDASGWSSTGDAEITDAPHWIELHMKRATGAGANNGFVYIYVDQNATPDASATSIDDDTRDYDDVSIGACGSLDAGTSGTLYFDDIVLRDDGTAIGPEAIGNPWHAYAQQ